MSNMLTFLLYFISFAFEVQRKTWECYNHGGRSGSLCVLLLMLHLYYPNKGNTSASLSSSLILVGIRYPVQILQRIQLAEVSCFLNTELVLSVSDSQEAVTQLGTIASGNKFQLLIRKIVGQCKILSITVSESLVAA